VFIRILGFFVAFVAIVSACSDSHVDAASPTAPTPQPGITSTMPLPTFTPAVTPDGHAAPEALTAYDAIDAALTEQAPTYYAGLELVSSEILIHVLDPGRNQVKSIVARTLAAYISGPLPADVVRVGTIPHPSDIRYVSATATLASLQARQALLTSAASRLQAEGVTLTAWGPDVSTNALDVSVQQPATAAVRSKIVAVVGQNNLHVVGNQAPATAA